MNRTATIRITELDALGADKREDITATDSIIRKIFAPATTALRCQCNRSTSLADYTAVGGTLLAYRFLAPVYWTTPTKCATMTAKLD